MKKQRICPPSGERRGRTRLSSDAMRDCRTHEADVTRAIAMSSWRKFATAKKSAWKAHFLRTKIFSFDAARRCASTKFRHRRARRDALAARDSPLQKKFRKTPLRSAHDAPSAIKSAQTDPGDSPDRRVAAFQFRSIMGQRTHRAMRCNVATASADDRCAASARDRHVAAPLIE